MAVFSWGFGKNGQLGHGRKETALLPNTVTFDKDFKSRNCSSAAIVSAGGLHSALCTREGKLFSFGCGKHGRLGTGDETDRCIATAVTTLDAVNVVQVSCGLWHGCAVADDGALYSWGYNKSHNVLGRRTSAPFNEPSRVEALADVRIIGVSCGNNFTLAWDDSGRAYSWGYGKHGVLGHGSESDVDTPKIIENLAGSYVVSMNAGYSHCGAVTKDGRVFMFGQGKYGALGLGPKTLSDQATPTLIPAQDGATFVQISCSVGEHHGHTLALTDSGSVFAWGDGYKGKLGLGDQEFRYTPTAIPREHFSGECVTQVSAGGIHSACVSEAGHVFTWGCGSDGRLGHAEAAGHRYLFRSDTPRVVETLREKGSATQVAASYYHTVALLEK